jgi:4'-phosphopantetheinyl transferase
VLVAVLALDQPPDVEQALAALLAPDESARAERLHGDDLRRRFRVAHGALRLLLGDALARDPASLRLEDAPGVKPRLADPPDGLSFSLSHSHELALVALTARAPIGVDVEHVRPLAERWRLAESVFTPAEIRALRAEPPERQERAWFEHWTRKEAVLKALGLGLTAGACAVELLAPDFAPTAVHERARGVAGTPWVVTGLQPAPDYAAALAAPAPVGRARLVAWPRVARGDSVGP